MTVLLVVEIRLFAAAASASADFVVSPSAVLLLLPLVVVLLLPSSGLLLEIYCSYSDCEDDPSLFLGGLLLLFRRRC